MSLTPAFLDEVRDRTLLSALIGRSIALDRAGAEYKACCPFHGEKTPSFTVNDEKGFYHCFGCGAHGDAIRWLTDHGGMGFLDAVAELAGAAGLAMPARTPQQAQREEARESASAVLARAATWYAAQLPKDAKQMAALAARGVGEGAIARFGLGLAPHRAHVSGCGVPVDQLVAAGLMIAVDNGFVDRFRDRLIIPIHDTRGRVVGFGGRATREDQQSKYINSEGGLFDKGRTLFNMHRAAPAARAARRLVLVEGYFDVIALDGAGISEAVAPMGTALTEAQMALAWRVHHCPIVLTDGDAAGRRAAAKIALAALVHAAPGQSLAFAALPEGQDPDDLAQAGGRDAIEAVIGDAIPLVEMVWRGAIEAAQIGTPEGQAAFKRRIRELVGTIRDAETRAEYDAAFRTRLADAFPPPPPWAADFDILPIGSVDALEQQPEAVRARLETIADIWLRGRVTHAEPGRDALLKLAFSVGRRIGAGLLGEGSAKEAIWPLYEDLLGRPEAAGGITHALIDRAMADGKARPWDIGPDLVTMQCATLPMTDFGIAERFILRFGRDFWFTTAKGWLGWDERRWHVLDQDKDGPPPAQLQGALFDCIRAIQDEARFMERTGVGHDDNPHGMDRLIPKGKLLVRLSDLLRQFGRQSETAGKPDSIAKLSRRWLTIAIESFDRDPFAINVLNGTLRFRREKLATGKWSVTVELEPHDRAQLNTKLAPIDYEPQAGCPVYDRFLAWAQPDADIRRYLHQWAGYSASGDISAQILHYWYGLGANGKSTTIDLWARVLGDYAGTIGIESFLDQGIKKRGDQATPDLAKLGGVRLLRASEPSKGARLDEALIKKVTGDDSISVRMLNRGFFDLAPTFKITISANYKVTVTGTDEGIWRRVKLVPWLSHVSDSDRDDTLLAQLTAEAAGVFNHIVRGLFEWLEAGFDMPEAVSAATAEFREESDALGRFLDDCTVREVGSRVQSSHLHAVFIAWAKAAGETEWNNKVLAMKMTDKGMPKKTSNGVQWLDLRLVRQASDFLDEHGKVLADLPGAMAGDRGEPSERYDPHDPRWDDDDVPF